MVQESPQAAAPIDVDGRRFEVQQDGLTARLNYHVELGRLTIVHTEVPSGLSGMGVGGRLVEAAVARANAEHLTVVPWCPFARRWLREHPGVAAVTSIDWDSRPGR